MRREYADMPLSNRTGDEYLALRLQRRSDLEAILRRGIDETNREKALDMICAICGEQWWARSIDGLLDDGAHPAIDIMATETAGLVAWALHEGGFTISVRNYVARELRRRLFMPLIAHDDYDCMRPSTQRALTMLCQIMFAALIAEVDQSRLNALLRRTAKIADDIIAADTISGPLGQRIADWTEATAFWSITRMLTGHQPMTRALPLNKWLDTLLLSHMGDGVFVDSLGGGLTKDVNGADVYFLGSAAGDNAVMALGAALYRENSKEPCALNARLIVDNTMDMLTGSVSAPRFKHGALEDGSLMCARGGGALVTMHSGGCGNAGGACIYVDDAPVLIACRDGCVKVNGMAMDNNSGAGDCELDEERADMSVDMTRAFPKEAGVRFMQRTVMLDRITGMTRVIDMLECDEQGEVTYVFESPCEPVPVPGALALGRTLFSWDGEMEAKVGTADGESVFGGSMYRIELAYRLRPGSNMFNFVVEPT